MSETDSDSFFTATSTGASLADVEKQIPDLPEDWKPPSFLFRRLSFALGCFFAVGHTSLEQFWHRVNEENRWERYLTSTCGTVAHITTPQGLVLTAASASMTSWSDTTTYPLLFVSFTVSILGLSLQVMFFTANQALVGNVGLNRAWKPIPRGILLRYCVLYRMTFFAFLVSMLALACALTIKAIGLWYLSIFGGYALLAFVIVNRPHGYLYSMFEAALLQSGFALALCIAAFQHKWA